MPLSLHPNASAISDWYASGCSATYAFSWRDYKAGDTASFAFKRKHFFDKETTNAIKGGEG